MANALDPGEAPLGPGAEAAAATVPDRTWHASVQALGLLLGGGPAAPAEGVSATQRLQAVVCAVARRLGNTPTVCRKAYIHPAVLALGQLLADPAQGGELMRQPWATRPPRGPAGLERTERQLLGLLEHLARQERRGHRTRPGRDVPPRDDAGRPPARQSARAGTVLAQVGA